MEEKQKKNPCLGGGDRAEQFGAHQGREMSWCPQMSFKFLIKNGNTYSSVLSLRLGITWAVLRIFALNLDNLSTFLNHSTASCRQIPFQSCLGDRINEQRPNTYIFLLDWKHCQTKTKGYCISLSKR